MLKEYRIGNFKAFSDSQTIPIKPITLIFGKNSSGKSSIIQSLLMLKQTVEEAESPEIPLLSQGNLVDLGRNKEFIFKHDKNNILSLRLTFNTPLDFDDIPENEIIKNNLEVEADINNIIELLRGNNDIDSYGIEFQFAFEDNNIYLKSINLFAGADKSPFYTYEYTKKEDYKENNIEYVKDDEKSNFNNNHLYWKFHWSVCHEGDDDFESRADKYILKYKTNDNVYGKKDTHSKEVNSKIEKAIDFYSHQMGRFEFKKLFNFLPLHQPYGSYSKDVFVPYIAECLGAIILNFLKRSIYLSSQRNYPERYYIYENCNLGEVGISGKKTPSLLSSDYVLNIIDKVNDMLKKININYQINIKNLKDDQGDSDVFMIQFYDKKSDILLNSLKDIGFGVSQVLPIIVQSVVSNKRTILIEQPELHLHPAAQAELGDMFIKSALGNNQNKFIIETHSEHLILRLLRRIRETTDDELPDESLALSSDQVSVLYVQSDKNGSKITHLNIDEEGEFEESWPEGFFDERAKELF